jgi:hypothetical protein
VPVVCRLDDRRIGVQFFVHCQGKTESPVNVVTYPLGTMECLPWEAELTNSVELSTAREATRCAAIR